MGEERERTKSSNTRGRSSKAYFTLRRNAYAAQSNACFLTATTIETIIFGSTVNATHCELGLRDHCELGTEERKIVTYT